MYQCMWELLRSVLLERHDEPTSTISQWFT